MTGAAASLLDSLARALPPLAGAAMLVLALAMPLARRVGLAALLAASQAACLALAALALAAGSAPPRHAGWELLAVALGTLALKTAVLPRAANALAPALAPAPSGPGGPRPAAVALAAAAAALLALVLAAPAVGTMPALALSVVLAGAICTALRRDPLGRIAGILVLENGLVLALAAAAAPGLALLALATLALPGAMIAALLRRVLRPTSEGG